MKFKIDIYAWIPQADVPNPLHSMPGGTGMWGPGACGPRFGGDNFTTPPSTPTGWAKLTYRAKQQLEFDASSWGATPVTSSTTGVVAGTTTVLTAPRPSGRICHSMTATVLKSSASVAYSASDKWYEIKMHGKVMDPYPANAGATGGGHIGKGAGSAVGGQVAGPIGSFAGGVVAHQAGSAAGSATASAATPALEWKLKLRIQKGTSIGLLTRTGYAAECPLPTLDVRPGGTSTSLGGGTANLMHGVIEVRRYPSYIVYVTQGSLTQVLFFADASGRNLLEIAIPYDSQVRRTTW